MVYLKLQNIEADVSLLKECSQVRAPIAEALDTMQGESQDYLGCLLLTIAITLKKLRERMAQQLRFCNPLVDAII